VLSTDYYIEFLGTVCWLILLVLWNSGLFYEGFMGLLDVNCPPFSENPGNVPFRIRFYSSLTLIPRRNNIFVRYLLLHACIAVTRTNFYIRDLSFF